ncbi:electron transfer flavoprotein subunit beta/FixA family protein [Chloroflexota bacterium]
MDIVVCVKRVPETSEADVVINREGRGIEASGLVFDINEWDKYAVEEAVLLKEKHGGSVTVVTVGPEAAEDTLRRCFATGADNAVRLTEVSSDLDAAAIARALYGVVKDLSFDLLLTGVQASDDGGGQVGPVLAELLGVPHATLVTGIDVLEGKVRVLRELESGLGEVVEVPLPAVLTIQTGINEPRYVSIMGVRKASKKEIEMREISPEVGVMTRLERLFLPPVTRQAEILEGSPDEVAERLAQILKDKAGLS